MIKLSICFIGLFFCVTSNAGPFLTAAAIGDVPLMERIVLEKSQQIESDLKQKGRSITGPISPDTLARLALYMEKNEQDQNALHLAALNRKFDSVQYLVSYWFPLTVRDRTGETAFHSVVAGGSLSIVDYLHQSGLSYFDPDKEGNNALHLAAQHKRTEVAEAILEKQGDDSRIFAQNKDGDTPVIVSAKVQDASTAMIMIEKNSPISITNGEGRTVLHYAVENGMAKLADALFARGAQIEVRDRHGQTPLDLARKFPEIESYLKGQRDDAIFSAIQGADQLKNLNTIKSELTARKLSTLREKLLVRVREVMELKLSIARTVAEVDSLNKQMQVLFPEIEPRSYFDRIRQRVTQIIQASADPEVKGQTTNDLSDNLVLTQGRFPGIVTNGIQQQIFAKLRSLLLNELGVISDFGKLKEHLTNRTNRHPGLLNETLTQAYQQKAMPLVEQDLDVAKDFPGAKAAFQSSYAFWRPDQVPPTLKEKARLAYSRTLPQEFQRSRTLEQLNQIKNDMIGLIGPDTPEHY